jgi:hypothetical protein
VFELVLDEILMHLPPYPIFERVKEGDFHDHEEV